MPRTARAPELQAAGRRVVAELSAARRQSGLTAARVAQLAGISVDSMRAIESGRVIDPGFLTVAALAEVLQLDLGELATTARGQTPPGPDKPPIEE